MSLCAVLGLTIEWIRSHSKKNSQHWRKKKQRKEKGIVELNFFLPSFLYKVIESRPKRKRQRKRNKSFKHDDDDGTVFSSVRSNVNTSPNAPKKKRKAKYRSHIASCRCEYMCNNIFIRITDRHYTVVALGTLLFLLLYPLRMTWFLFLSRMNTTFFAWFLSLSSCISFVEQNNNSNVVSVLSRDINSRQFMYTNGREWAKKNRKEQPRKIHS